MEWIKTKEQLPEKDGKYLVVVDCDGESKNATISSYKTKSKRFHFDMHHIKWKVIKWIEIPNF